MLLVEEPAELGERSVFVLAEVVVAAGEGDTDVDPEAAAGADRTLDPLRRRAGGLLTAQAREELVQVVDDLHALPRSGPSNALTT